MSKGHVILVVGPPDSGKTSLIQRITNGVCPERPKPTIGLDMEAGHIAITPIQEDLVDDLATVIPSHGLDFDLWEIGGREADRRPPRGQRVDGLLVCYDATKRASFQRATHVLCRVRVDAHLEHGRYQGHSPAPQRMLPAVLCGTKLDEPGSDVVSDEEVQAFLEQSSASGAVLTSAKSGEGISRAMQLLALAILRADFDFFSERRVEAVVKAKPAAKAWGLRCAVAGSISKSHRSMTSPWGARPHEPHRGGDAQRLVEVLRANGELDTVAPRTAAQCLQNGMLHRAVHVWLWVPRQGALLLRRYAPDSVKHPDQWGPTCHTEVHCYGMDGDGHASELSAQAAERAIMEQLGIKATNIGTLEHWFSCESCFDGCNELLDIYVSPIIGLGLPPVELLPGEDVDWVYFVDVFGPEAVEAGTILHMEDEYRSFMLQRLRKSVVDADAFAAFGDSSGICARWLGSTVKVSGD